MLSSKLRRRSLLKKPRTPCLFLNRIANESYITGLVPPPRAGEPFSKENKRKCYSPVATESATYTVNAAYNLSITVEEAR